MKKLVFIFCIVFLNWAICAQPFTQEELKWFKMIYDEQAFAEFPGFMQIKAYRDYFGKMLKDNNLSDAEIDFIGRWGIPDGIGVIPGELPLYKRRTGWWKAGSDEDPAVYKNVINGAEIFFFPDHTLLSRTSHDAYFPLRALIGKWKIENDTLYGKVERIISVKVPLQLDTNKSCILKPEDFIERDISQDWKVLLTNVSSSYDKKLRYTYRPFNPLLTANDLEINFRYFNETIRYSTFGDEAFFKNYNLIGVYKRLQDYLNGKLKIWDYIGTEVRLLH